MLDQAVAELVVRHELLLGRRRPGQAVLLCTEMQGRVVDRALQLFGGFGYIRESLIGRLYADARVSRIYGGTREVLNSSISKSMGL